MQDRYGVIFDVDGVLVDSYQAHFESWLQLAIDEGQTLTEEEFGAHFGRTSREIMADQWPDLKLTEADMTAWDDRKERHYREIVATDFPVMPGAITLIDDLTAAGFALALGSSGPAENVLLARQMLDRVDEIAVTVTGQDVSRGKPDPEVFLTAAERLGIAPERCAVIEDACHGISAANRAGMVSIALVSTGHTRDEFVEADQVVDRLAELSAAQIGEWIAAAHATA